jgi:uncharacterized membrane protein YphA (DoxX/SURF4 family)
MARISNLAGGERGEMPMIHIGNRIYGAAAIALGLVGLAWGDFAAVWQPVPPETPGYTALAYATAVLLCGAGAALQWRRTSAAGALLLALFSTIFAILWARRIIGHPEIFAVWSGTAEQLALAVGGLAVYVSQRPGDELFAVRFAKACRLVFGLSLVAFGAAHFLYVTETAAMVPAWLPPGQRVWALATGAAHLLAGLALLSGIRALLAARLLTAMFVGFGLLVWLPQLFSAPHEHMAWAGNAINFALIGAAWAVADMIARFDTPTRSPAAA